MKAIVLILTFVNLIVAQSDRGNPPPPQTRTPGFGLPLPIDDHLWLLVVVGLCLAGYVAYRKVWQKA